MNWTVEQLIAHYERQGMSPPEALARVLDTTKEKMRKYRSRKKEVDGYMFDSCAEAEFYTRLIFERNAGLVADLELQPRFLLQEGFRGENGKWNRPIEYVADFQFLRILPDHLGDQTIVVDVKSAGTMTPLFRLKHKLFRKRYPLVLLELWAKRGKEWTQL